VGEINEKKNNGYVSNVEEEKRQNASFDPWCQTSRKNAYNKRVR
jgi:hypothetical protein